MRHAGFRARYRGREVTVLAVEAEKSVKVLLVDRFIQARPNEDELDFFRQALSPSKA